MNAMENVNSRLGQAEERICELKDSSYEIYTEKRKNNEKCEDLQDLEDTIK
jgi:hypothetical protein